MIRTTCETLPRVTGDVQRAPVRTPTVALVIAAVCVLLSLVAATLGVIDGDPSDVLMLLLSLPATLLGARILIADPDNRVGRRLLGVGAAFSWLIVIAAVEDHVLLELGRPEAFVGRLAAMLDDNSFVLVLTALAALVVVFPDGRALTPRLQAADRWALRGAAAFYAIGLFSGNELGVEGDPPVWSTSLLPNFNSVLVWIIWPGILALFVWLLVATWSVRRRFRQAHGIERLQLSWLVYGAATIPLVIVLCFAEAVVTDSPTAAGLLLTAVAVPACVAVAILRYRLYDIDRLVNRSLVYFALTVLLGAVYAAIALGLGVLLGGNTGWAVAAATLAVATAFRPVRDRVQRRVDRRFARRRYLGLRAVEEFLEDVRAGRDEPERIGEVLAEALDDDGLEVWFRLPATDAWADATGRIGEPPMDTVRARTPVRRGDLELGLVLHDPALADTPDTLESVIRAAGLAMEIARLRVEVRVQLAQVQSAHARLAVAAEAERRKLERDLHDGAQQRLIALGLAVRHAQSQLEGNPGAAFTTLDGAVDEVTSAVAELRAIARGLRPSLLEGGLAAALTGLADRAPLPVTVEVAPGALNPELEATAFYLVSEALTNVAKHANARRAGVHVDFRNGGLRVEVADDGTGGASAVPGGGMTGMSERVAARGGTVRVESPRGGGTRVIAELPAAS